MKKITKPILKAFSVISAWLILVLILGLIDNQYPENALTLWKLIITASFMLVISLGFLGVIDAIEEK